MQRKATKQTRGPNAAEKRYMAWLHSGIPCAACGKQEATIGHHMMGSAWKAKVGGITVLLGHWGVLGLCARCDAVVTHGSRRQFTEQYGSQRSLWQKQISASPFFPKVPQLVWSGIMESTA